MKPGIVLEEGINFKWENQTLIALDYNVEECLREVMRYNIIPFTKEVASWADDELFGVTLQGDLTQLAPAAITALQSRIPSARLLE